MAMEGEFTETEGKIIRTFRNKEREDGLIKVGDVKKEKIDWLWEPYIPLGRLSMIGGDPGAGKSFITTSLASLVSTGGAFPGEEEGLREPQAVLMLSVEDDPGDTIRPRLEGMRANLCLIYISIKDLELNAEGFQEIRRHIKRTGAKLVIIDPIVAFLGAKTDMNRANEVRSLMRGLSHIAREFNIAIVIVRHNRKEGTSGPGKAIYAGMGSIDFTASVRSEMAVTEAKNGVKFFNHIKTNTGRKGRSLTYSITSADDGSPVFAWGDFTNWPPVAGAAGVSKITRKFKGEDKIKRWLFDILKAHPEGVMSIEVHSLGRLAGFSDTKLEHSKKGIALSERRGDSWYWKLDPAYRSSIASDDAGMVE